jgi:oligopeptide/dipeptide ABC transporter ATP-binding protein
MNDVLLEVKRLKKYFPIYSGIFRHQVGTVKAVDDVSFTIPKGKVVGMVGESGCGKSTIGRACIRLIEPTAGEINFQGKSLLQLSSAQLKETRKDIQMVFQDPYASLNPRKTIQESIGEALTYHGLVKTKEEQRDAVADVLKRIGLSPDVMGRYPHEFSGGQQQRICIGRAIALNPQLLICDEAVSALDVSVQAQIINLLLELKETLQLSYLFISHDLSVIRYMADYIIVLYLGKIMECASTEELFSNPRHPYTQALLSAVPKRHPSDKKQRIILKGDIPSPSHPPSGCPFRTRCPFAQPICSEPPPHKIMKDKETGEEDHHYFCIL